MAEAAPLATAHAHARKAARETQLNNWTEAAEEHKQAAIDFGRASITTTDSEALRILALLKEQHVRLARTIKTQPNKPTSPAPKPTSVNAPPVPSPALVTEMASRRGIPTASRNPPSRSTSVKTQTQEEMQLENLTLKQTLEGLVGKINGLEETNAKYEKTLKKYHTRWEELRKSAQEKERAKRERAAAKDKESTSGD